MTIAIDTDFQQDTYHTTVKALRPSHKLKDKPDMKVPVCPSPFISQGKAHTLTSLFQVLKLRETDQTHERF